MDPRKSELDEFVKRDNSQGMDTAALYGMSGAAQVNAKQVTSALDGFVNPDAPEGHGGLANPEAKKKKRTRPKVDEDLLVGPRGLRVILEELSGEITDKEGKKRRKTRFRGPGHEQHNLTKMLKIYREWGTTMFQQMDFNQLMDRIEGLGNKPKVKEFMYNQRMKRDDPERYREEVEHLEKDQKATLVVGDGFQKSMELGEGVETLDMDAEAMMNEMDGPAGPALGPWDCKQCQNPNPAESKFCDMCSCARPASTQAAPQSSSPWQCGRCGESNTPDNKFCGMCEMERPNQAAPKKELSAREKRLARVAELKAKRAQKQAAPMPEPGPAAASSDAQMMPVPEPDAQMMPVPEPAPAPQTIDIETINYRTELAEIIRHCDRNTMTTKGVRKILEQKFNLPKKALKSKKEYIKKLIDEILESPEFNSQQATQVEAGASVDFGSRPISPASHEHPATANMELDLDIDEQAGTQVVASAPETQSQAGAGMTDSADLAETVDADNLADTQMDDTQVQESTLPATIQGPSSMDETLADTIPLATPTDSQEW